MTAAVVATKLCPAMSQLLLQPPIAPFFLKYESQAPHHRSSREDAKILQGMEGEVSWCLLFQEPAIPRGWLRQEGLRKHGLVLVPWDMATVLSLSLDFWNILTSILGLHGSYTNTFCLNFLINQITRSWG